MLLRVCIEHSTVVGYQAKLVAVAFVSVVFALMLSGTRLPEQARAREVTYWLPWSVLRSMAGYEPAFSTVLNATIYMSILQELGKLTLTSSLRRYWRW